MTQTVGPYRLIRHIATGGMAEVWLARHAESQGEEVALKRILPHLARDERFATMFMDEAEIGSRLQHDNVVRVIDVGHDEDEYFIAMEYVEGPDLAQILDRCEETGFKVTVGVASRLVIGVLRALDYAHNFELDGVPQNIVHRDVSPHNILVTADGGVKLIDFGVAKAVERHSKTETGFVKGKLSYMSPEQIGQEELDRRADLFGVGALFFELLTGRTPFGRELTAVSAILEEDPPDIHAERDDVPEAIVDAIERALAKKPQDRWDTAGDMADAIEEALQAHDSSAAAVAQFLAELEASTEIFLRETSDAGRVTTPMTPSKDLLESHKKKPKKLPVPADTSAKVELTGALAAESAGDARPSLVLPVIVLILLLIGFGGYLARRQLAGIFGADDVAEVAEVSATENPEQPADPPEQPEPSEAPQDEAPAAEPELEESAEAVESTGEDGFTFDEDVAEAMYADAAALRSIELEKAPENWLIEFWGPALIDAVAEPEPADKRWDPGDPNVVDILDFTPRPEIDEAPAPKVTKRKRRVKSRPKSKPRKKVTKPPAKKKKRDGYKRMESAVPNF